MRHYLQIFFVLSIVVLAGCKSLPPGKSAVEAYQAGFQEMANGSNKAALADFSQAIKRDPRFVSAYLSRARVEISLTNDHAALADWTKVIELEPTNEPVLVMSAAIRLQFNDDVGASNDLDRALSLSPDDLRARGFRGLLRVNERDWDGAKADFSDVIQTDPADATAYRGRAAVEMMDKDYEQGITDATTAIRLDPENAQGAYHLRAHGRVNLKDYAGAMADAFELVKLDPSNVAGYFARAEIRILCDDFSGASNDLQTALRMSPTNTAVYVCRAMLEQKCREPQAALADLGRMLALDPQSSHVPEIYEAMGYEQEDLHQWRPALKDFHKGMAYHSPPDGLRFQVFILRCRLGERPQALEDLDAYLHSLPASKTNDWTASIANFLAGHLDEKEFLVRATTTAKRPTDIADQICDAYYFEGMEHLLAGDKAGAGELFQKCLNTRQDNSYNYMNAVAELDDLKNH